MTKSIAAALLIATGISLSSPAAAAEWWYVAHDADRVMFVDQRSITREGEVARYSALVALHDAGRPAGEIQSFMRADCDKHEIGWGGRVAYDRRDVQGDVSTRSDRDIEMARPAAGSLEDAQLQFVCDPAKRLFPLAIDEVAFAERVIATTTDPRALHDAMAKDPRVPIVRSSAPDTRTFGTIQTVKRGEPMVPPRDYRKGPQVPRSADYDADTVGVIYDVAYLGIKDGEIAFEIRGYSGDDMVHPGSGQTETSPIGPSPIGVKTTNIRDLAFTIIKATPDAITYRVKIEKQAPVQVDDCTAGGCDELLTVEAEVPTPAKRPRRKQSAAAAITARGGLR